MYSSRSSIRKPWGTITHPKERHPDKLLGYQKLNREQVRDVVNRLYQENWHEKRERKRSKSRQEYIARERRHEVKRSAAEVEDIVQRLTRNSERNVTDSNRTGAMKECGIYNTFACKGWNWLNRHFDLMRLFIFFVVSRARLRNDMLKTVKQPYFFIFIFFLFNCPWERYAGISYFSRRSWSYLATEVRYEFKYHGGNKLWHRWEEKRCFPVSVNRLKSRDRHRGKMESV